MLKRLTALLLTLVLLCTSSALAWGDEDLPARYNEAVALLQQGHYALAADAFSALGYYQDASQMAMYCYAITAGESGFYGLAVNNLSSLGNFRDSALLAAYYAALSYEAAEEYETAQEKLVNLYYYRDVSARLATYPEKILARDYMLADSNERAGRLEKARDGFLALGSYKDSAQRAAAVKEKILTRDYALAEAAEKENRLEDALKGFKALGNYQDSPDRAAGVQEKIYARDYDAADKAERDGDYAASYEGFVALGDYRDSRDRAARVEDKGKYAQGMKYALQGKYSQAYELFAELAQKDYEDSADKAYALGVTEFAKVSDRGDGVAAFKFHELYGLINVKENLTVSPYWSEIGQFNELGLAKVYRDGKYGYINRRGEEVIACQWDDVSAFSGDLCTVMKVTKDNSGWSTYYYHDFGLVDKNGRIVSNAQWRQLGSSYHRSTSSYGYDISAPSFSEGRIKVMNKDSQWGFIDMNGNRIGEVKWASISDFSEGLAVVKDSNDKYGFINKDGQVVIQPQYLEAYSFSEGLAAVKTGDHWQYIDQNNRVIIQPLYTQVTSFKGGRADVFLPGTGWQIIDSKGGLVYFVNNETKAQYEHALSLMEEGLYDDARAIFLDLVGYKDATAKAEECVVLKEAAANEAAYQLALQAMNEGRWDSAAKQFRALKDYKDAAAKAEECIRLHEEAQAAAEEKKNSDQYEKATVMMKAGEWDKAAEAFASLGSYKDAAAKAEECVNHQLSELYEQAAALNAAGDFGGAYRIFTALGDYQDAAQQAEALLQANPDIPLQTAVVGDTVFFGRYEQDGNESNGKEPIEWMVLDQKGSKLLLLSRYALDKHVYHTSETSITWANCSLRKWMNGDFMKAMFTAEEQKLIQKTNAIAHKNQSYNTKAGSDTEDKVFLLSEREVKKYFPNIKNAQAVPTEALRKKGANEWQGGVAWLTRTPGRTTKTVVTIYQSGSLNSGGTGVNAPNQCVRPAVWVNVENYVGPQSAVTVPVIPEDPVVPAKQVSNTNQGSTAVNSAVYEEIAAMAHLLDDGERMEGPYRLFGTVTKIDTAWSSSYQNITVTIQVGDRADLPIMCYRLTGEGAQNLKVGDQITVEGVLKNYKGTIEFDAGCKLVGYGEVLK